MRSIFLFVATTNSAPMMRREQREMIFPNSLRFPHVPSKGAKALEVVVFGIALTLNPKHTFGSWRHCAPYKFMSMQKHVE